MSQDRTFVIVGGGLTAGSAAERLRDEGFDGQIVLLAAEGFAPYIRPPLSKEYLLGAAERDTIFVHPDAWYSERDIDLRRGRSVVALNVPDHAVTLDDGQNVRYDAVLLATGAAPRTFGPVGDADGVHYLRTVGQSEALRAQLEPGGRRVVVIGSGWIGMETAAAARHYGNEVTVLGRSSVPLEAALGTELGEVFAGLHRDNGVELRMPVSVRELAVDGGAVTAVVLDDGERVTADVVIVAIGAVPDTGLAERAGLDVDDGILVDEGLRASAPDVFAAGDAANAFHPFLGRRLRVEHWANALNGGAAAAKSMLGRPVVYDDIPYFYTDQYDLGMEYSGFGSLAADAEVVYRGDVPGREFISFWVHDDRVVAGMNVNIWDVNEQIAELIRSRARVDKGRLADQSVALDAVTA